jgi:hypothetical protein
MVAGDVTPCSLMYRYHNLGGTSYLPILNTKTATHLPNSKASYCEHHNFDIQLSKAKKDKLSSVK